MSYPIKIINRKDAKAAGLKRYFTGKQCKSGHIAERYVSSHGCYECVKKWLKSYYAQNPHPYRERSRKRRTENPEKVRETCRLSRLKHLEKRRNNVRKYRETHREQIAIQKKEHRDKKENRELAFATYRKWYQKNYTLIRAKEKERSSRNVRNLTDSYIRRILSNNSPLRCKDIPQPLVDATRQHILLKRELIERNKRNDN